VVDPSRLAEDGEHLRMTAAASFRLSPLAGRGRIASSDAIRVRGTIRESECVESPPHPASGERGKNR
jgi:hypothetical protein